MELLHEQQESGERGTIKHRRGIISGENPNGTSHLSRNSQKFYGNTIEFPVIPVVDRHHLCGFPRSDFTPLHDGDFVRLFFSCWPHDQQQESRGGGRRFPAPAGNWQPYLHGNCGIHEEEALEGGRFSSVHNLTNSTPWTIDS